MIAGHLQEKKGFYYAVLSYSDAQGKRKTKWIATGYPVKGNKKKAQAFLAEQQLVFDSVGEEQAAVKDELFADYLERWLLIAKSTISVSTYCSYDGLLKSVILPWFRKTKVTLKALTARDIQELYSYELERVSANTVIHYHAVIHRALKYAVKTDLIGDNPADKVDRPKKNTYKASFYDGEEIKRLFECVDGTALEAPVKLAAFYGLRKSEVLGIRWNAIDFDKGTVSIAHTVIRCRIDGKYRDIAQDTTKTKSSRRTLPLTEPMRELLIKAKAYQAENRRLCGNCYRTEFSDYVCVTDIGDRMNSHQLSQSFVSLLKRNGLRHIRFHDLRHSCASLLLANGVPLKQIQEWLGHSDFNTTANIYAHLSAESRAFTAEAMLKGLGLMKSERETDE